MLITHKRHYDKVFLEWVSARCRASWPWGRSRMAQSSEPSETKELHNCCNRSIGVQSCYLIISSCTHEPEETDIFPAKKWGFIQVRNKIIRKFFWHRQPIVSLCLSPWPTDEGRAGMRRKNSPSTNASVFHKLLQFWDIVCDVPFSRWFPLS